MGGGVKTVKYKGIYITIKINKNFNHNNFNLLTFTWVFLFSLLTKDDYINTKFTFIVGYIVGWLEYVYCTQFQE